MNAFNGSKLTLPLLKTQTRPEKIMRKTVQKRVLQGCLPTSSGGIATSILISSLFEHFCQREFCPRLALHQFPGFWPARTKKPHLEYTGAQSFPFAFIVADKPFTADRKWIFTVSNESNLMSTIATDLLALFEANRLAVCRFLRSLGIDEDQAQSIVQDVWIKAQIEVERGGQINRSWLFSVARNLYFDQYRTQQRRRTISFDDAGSLDAPHDPQAVDKPPFAGLQHEELQIAIRECKRRLPESQQRALDLKFFEGLEYSKIQEIMDRSYQACVKLVFTAKQNMEQCLRSKGVVES